MEVATSSTKTLEQTDAWVVNIALLWAHRRTLVRVTMLVFVLSGATAFLLPKKYESSTRIMPPEQAGGSAAMLAALVGKSGGSGLASLAGGLLGSRGSGALFISLLRSGTVSIKGYVCLAGVHGIMEARRAPDLQMIFANAYLVAPDGMPTVWMGHLQGLSKMERVFGPDLMLEVIGRKELSHYRHFLCGGSVGVAEQLSDELQRRFPWACIAGTYTPPFRPMTLEEEVGLAAKVRLLRPDIIWVGLSTPKQDRFMFRYLPMLDTKVMLGVGAAFLFHTGAIQDSPDWVKRSGLQWLHRLLQEPTRLWRRYLRNIPVFIFLAILQISRLRRFPVRLCPISQSKRVSIHE